MRNVQRFSKHAVVAEIARRSELIRTVWHFDPEDGHAQVIGKGEHANRAYAEFRTLRDLAREMVE